METNIRLILKCLHYSFPQLLCFISQPRNVLSLIEELASLENYFPVDSGMSVPFSHWLLFKNLVSLVSIFLNAYPVFSSSYTCFLLKSDFIKCKLLLQAASVFLQKYVTWWMYLEDSEGQRSLACLSPWGYKESDTT